jgi:TRAP-type C4-dicarboxylate transport system permease small subunit
VHRVTAVLRRGVDLVGALLFLAMFAAFLLQVFTRYVLNAPLGWTLEACLVAYLWFVFWAAAFMLREDEHVRFDLLVRALPAAGRRRLAAASALATLGCFALAFPATLDWVRFMAIDRTWTLGIRFDLLFSIYILFMLAVIVRQVAVLLRQLHGSGDPYELR